MDLAKKEALSLKSLNTPSLVLGAASMPGDYMETSSSVALGCHKETTLEGLGHTGGWAPLLYHVYLETSV